MKKIKLLFLCLISLLFFSPSVFAANNDDKIEKTNNENNGEEVDNSQINKNQTQSKPVFNPDKDIIYTGKGFSLHKQNYFLPVTMTDQADGQEDMLCKFQFSFKQQIYNFNIYCGYTQKSYWKVLDIEDSRPFTETNYNPEIFYNLKFKQIYGFYECNFGYEHESNGAREPSSRSWDRIYATTSFKYSNFSGTFKVWYRIPEDDKEFPTDTKGDENSKILEYYGNTQLKLQYMWWKQHLITMIGRLNFSTGKSGVQFDYSFPTTGNNMFITFYLWKGYGDSLIEYNQDITRAGVGIMFKR